MSTRPLLLALAGLAVLAGPALAQSDTARLQVIHNAPDPAAETVDVYVNGDLFLDDLAFREGTAFVDVPAGVELAVDVTAADADDNADPVFSGAYTLDAGVAYQLIATGVLDDDDGDDDGDDADGFTLLVSADAQEAPAGGASVVAVRVVHGAPDAPAVDVRAGGAVLVDDVAYTDVSPYLELAPAAYTLDVTTADGATTVASFAADLAAGGGAAVTVLASGFLSPEDDEPAFGLLAVFADGSEALLALATPAEDDPAALGLSLDVPNPIRGEAQVAFASETAGPVRLVLLDALGRQVAVLADGPAAPGPQTARLGAAALAAGVYVLRLETDGGALTRTVTVVR